MNSYFWNKNKKEIKKLNKLKYILNPNDYIKLKPINEKDYYNKDLYINAILENNNNLYILKDYNIDQFILIPIKIINNHNIIFNTKDVIYKNNYNKSNYVYKGSIFNLYIDKEYISTKYELEKIEFTEEELIELNTIINTNKSKCIL